MDDVAVTDSSDMHVKLVGVSKHYGGVQALKSVDLSIRRGSVHALVGENGAGKSTLSKIIAGREVADQGELLVDGHAVTLHSPREALGHSIASIAQELAIVPGLSAAANVFLGSEPRTGPVVRRRELLEQFTALCERTGFDLPAAQQAGSLRTADQQKVEIMRALANGARFIVMDEPTAALPRADADRLRGVIRAMADAGNTILLISHFLDEVLALADEVTILRDGNLVRSGSASAETNSTLIEGMLGRSLESVFPDKVVPVDPELVLRAGHVNAPGVSDVSLTVGAGEIVALAGLVGAGRSELAHAIMGSRRHSGTVEIHGVRVKASPVDAVRKGIGLVPESRKEQGLLLSRSIRENTTLACLSRYSTGTWIRRRSEALATKSISSTVTINTSNHELPVESLSGGNQQKVLFGRILLSSPSLIIADEPTRGVDVGSRRAIYEVLIDQARQGMAVLMISSDIEEVLGLAHRVVVMRNGKVTAELSGEAMTEQRILKAAFDDSGQVLSPDEPGKAEARA